MGTSAQALEAFYGREHLPEGGVGEGYIDWARAFGIPFPIVNTADRLAVMPYHDLHHLVTGYATDEAGEAEVSGWTIASGGGPAYGRIYDLGAFALGLLRFPRRTVAAFYLGRQCKNLYDRPADEWLAEDPEVLKAHCGTVRPVAPPTVRDRLALFGSVAAALAVWASPIAPAFLVLGTVKDLVKG